ncbi:Pyruvate/Phosphoenolpyruvate kinase-like domain-containing protein [Podospora conica]|nr:Pyruvate/Phosphoenolpyruvate kinase-like domain-containing protein [Schizothecium conicum]
MATYAAPSLFQPHRARQALRDAKDGKIPPLMVCYLGLSSIPTARFIAPFGFDAVWIDWEHTACNVETMTTMVHDISFMSGGRSIPFVRVPGHDHAAIGYALDAGASIVIPQIETVAQAQHVLSASKFGTRQRGTRSAPPFRLIPGITDARAVHPHLDVWQNLNEQAAVMIQIETLEGIRNLDAILTAVPDIDAVWLGTLDARISMNLPAGFGVPDDEPEWVEAVRLYEETMEKHGKVKGGFVLGGEPETIRAAARDKEFLCGFADVLALMGMAGSLGQARAALAEVGGDKK